MKRSSYLKRVTMKKINNGQAAPDFTLSIVDGDELSLNEILSEGKHVLLVFLRHLG